jgi:hypothetical protein
MVLPTTGVQSPMHRQTANFMEEEKNSQYLQMTQENILNNSSAEEAEMVI